MKRLLIALSCFISVNIYSQSITNTLGTNGLFMIKDVTNNYLTLSQTTGQVNILKTLRLENTTSSTTGVMFKGANRFMHNYGTNNMFMGINSGNFTMTVNGTSGAFQNTGIGINTLSYLTTGYFNTAVGSASLFSNSNGFHNTGVGESSLYSNTGGGFNTAIGRASLYSNTTGFHNAALGTNSLYSNLIGTYNTAVGNYSLSSNLDGNKNTAVGYESMKSNTSGFNNTSIGYQSLLNNTSNYNTAVGFESMKSNTSGFNNTSIGYQSLLNNTGNYNTAVGCESMKFNTSGFNNTSLGYQSLLNNTGNYNTALGYNAGSTITTGANLTCLGIDAAPSSATALDQVTLGNGFVQTLRCNVQTISSLSDMRDKKNITDLTLGLDFLMKVKPRQFNWDKREWYEGNKSDGSKMKETLTAGFISQELDEVQTNENADWLNLVLKDNPEKLEATYGNLLPVMVKAIQELKVESEKLKVENEKLKVESVQLKTENKEIKQNNEKLASDVEVLKLMNEKIVKLEKMFNEMTSENQTSLNGQNKNLSDSKTGDGK